MSIKNKVNFKKGWPSPTIIEAVANPTSGVTTLEAGMVGHLNAAGTWVLGTVLTNSGGTIAEAYATPYIFHNDQVDGDAGNASADPLTSNPARYGGVHGISLQQPLVIETSQISTAYSTPVIGDRLAVSVVADAQLGKLIKAAIQYTRIIGTVTEAKHTYNGIEYITFAPELGTVFVPAS